MDNAASVWWVTDGDWRYDRQLDVLNKRVNFSNRTVLDAATGRGRFAIRFAEAGAKSITAVDISPKMIEIASENAKKAGTHIFEKIDFAVSDIENLGTDHKYDVINAMEIMVHLPNPKKTLENFHKILNDKGLLLMNVDYPISKYSFFHFYNNPVNHLKISLYRTCKNSKVFVYNQLPGNVRRFFANKYNKKIKYNYVSGSKVMKTTKEVIEQLKKSPDQNLSRAEDAIQRYKKKELVSMLIDTGFKVKDIIKEGKWWQIPYGIIIIAEKS
ncbi:class I SAM-dependent methyltransferase [bacterium]|nr:class I SAM-dependent methyltransferase [bacterium]MBU1634360.1 class I SAM-dependent methyltransferase [bacterium]